MNDKVYAPLKPITGTRQIVTSGDWGDTFKGVFDNIPHEFEGDVTMTCPKCFTEIRYELKNCRNFVANGETGMTFDADVTSAGHECQQS